MNIAYFDCFNGAAGDMILGALLDAGLRADELREALGKLPITGYELSIQRITKQGFAAMRFEVILKNDGPQPCRHLEDIREIIKSSELSPSVQRRAEAIFQRLARAEAEVHGTALDGVHFHEVGAVDAIIDIVGASWAIERLGIERVICSALPTGSGTVECQHGILPVPAPATALLLKGVPIAPSDEVGELTTPTGAAILTELADSFGPIPAMIIRHVGTGAGHREGSRRPNVLRVMLGEAIETSDEADRITVLETNIDDTTPEILGYTIERLLNAGALDAYCLPIYMKKSRPAMQLTVLAPVDRIGDLETVIFEETSTFGIRRHEGLRSTLSRREETVETPYGPIRVKTGSRAGRLMTVSPEYEDCREAASKGGVPLRVVMAAAVNAWKSRQG